MSRGTSSRIGEGKSAGRSRPFEAVTYSSVKSSMMNSELFLPIRDQLVPIAARAKASDAGQGEVPSAAGERSTREGEVPEREKKSTRSCKWEKYQVLPVGEVLNAAGGKSIRCFRWEKYWYRVLSREKYQVPPVGVCRTMYVVTREISGAARGGGYQALPRKKY